MDAFTKKFYGEGKEELTAYEKAAVENQDAGGISYGIYRLVARYQSVLSFSTKAQRKQAGWMSGEDYIKLYRTLGKVFLYFSGPGDDTPFLDQLLEIKCTNDLTPESFAEYLTNWFLPNDHVYKTSMSVEVYNTLQLISEPDEAKIRVKVKRGSQPVAPINDEDHEEEEGGEDMTLGELFAKLSKEITCRGLIHARLGWKWSEGERMYGAAWEAVLVPFLLYGFGGRLYGIIRSTTWNRAGSDLLTWLMALMSNIPPLPLDFDAKSNDRQKDEMEAKELPDDADDEEEEVVEEVPVKKSPVKVSRKRKPPPKTTAVSTVQLRKCGRFIKANQETDVVDAVEENDDEDKPPVKVSRENAIDIDDVDDDDDEPLPVVVKQEEEEGEEEKEEEEVEEEGEAIDKEIPSLPPPISSLPGDPSPHPVSASPVVVLPTECAGSPATSVGADIVDVPDGASTGMGMASPSVPVDVAVKKKSLVAVSTPEEVERVKEVSFKYFTNDPESLLIPSGYCISIFAKLWKTNFGAKDNYDAYIAGRNMAIDSYVSKLENEEVFSDKAMDFYKLKYVSNI